MSNASTYQCPHCAGALSFNAESGLLECAHCGTAFAEDEMQRPLPVDAMAEVLEADLYEIVPQEPYTDADLDWNDSTSRTSIETEDRNCRPAIAGELPDLAAYDTLFIGYPIWWGDTPRIVSNFVEQVDLTGKTLAVFFTSGSSGLGSSMKHLEQQSGAGKWLEGKRFTERTTVEALVNWAKGLGIEP